MENPCKLIEGDTVYEIGTMQGRKAVYDFEKMLAYLEAVSYTHLTLPTIYSV